ncbi:MAG: hypothetical protein LBP92_01625 [Deltaproteobacteria bacterium]|jgi:hypothetical protein|nr:hypothetical protein [Deltaproteobacteria bacterium]
MSKIICPNCKLSLKLPATSFIAETESLNIWMRCPHCNERFHAKKVDINKLIDRNNDIIYHNLVIQTQISTIVDTIKKTYPDNPLQASDLLYKPPTSKLLSRLGIISFAIIIMAFLALIPLSYIGSRPDPLPAQPRSRQDPSTYSEKELTRDLQALRQDVRAGRKIEREISYSGRESRIYKYLVNYLSTNYCQEIVSLRIWSNRTLEGLKLKGVCRLKDDDAAELSIKWYNDRIEAAIIQELNQVTIPLKPTS